MLRIIFSLLIINFIFTQKILKIPKLKNNINIIIDGIAQSDEWSDALELKTNVSSPVFLAPPSENTNIKITYDNEYIYFLFINYDKDMAHLQANGLRRDDWKSDDFVGFTIDTFNDNQNALGFVTNAEGVRIDYSVANDAQSNNGEPFNTSFNTYWTTSSKKMENSWVSEFKIPFSSLKFKTQDDNSVIMGVLAFRYLVRINEAQTYPDIDPKYDWGFMKASLAQDILFENIESKNPIYITPYISAGTSFNYKKNSDESSYVKENETKKDVGLDIKYNLSENITIDGTINTDFAQVEADDEQINLTRFSLFRPEKRAFFQERSYLFDFSGGGQASVFYTRQIGFSDSGAVRLLGGARIMGSIANIDVGFLSMQTDVSKALPSENFSVLRLKKAVLNDYSTLGFITTSRLSNNNKNYNLVFGFDADYRFPETDYYLSTRVSQSFDSDSINKNPSDFLDNSRLFLSFNTRRSVGWTYQLNMFSSGKKYSPEMGYMRRENVFGFGGGLGYAFLFDKESDWYSFKVNYFGFNSYQNDDGKIEDMFMRMNFSLSSKKGDEYQIKLENEQERFYDDFDELPNDIILPAGLYRSHKLEISYNPPFGDLFRMSFSAGFQYFYVGQLYEFGSDVSLISSSLLDLSLNYSYSNGQLHKFGEFTTNVIRTNIKTALNTEISSQLQFQVNSENKQMNLNARLRYNPSEGQDLYLVFDTAYNYDPYAFSPFKKYTPNQAIIFKYNYTLQL